MHGLQTWVALPTGAEESVHPFNTQPSRRSRSTDIGESTVRVAVGSGWDLESPITGSSPLVLAEITLTTNHPSRSLPIIPRSQSSPWVATFESITRSSLPDNWPCSGPTRPQP